MASGIWLQDFYRTGNSDSWRGHMQNLVLIGSRGKDSDPQEETEPDLPTSFGGSSAAWVSSGSPLGQECWQQRFWEVPMARTLLEDAISPTLETVDSRTRSHLAKKLTEREYSLSRLQTVGLKFYWAWPCPPGQDPVFHTSSPSHQEACRSLLASSTRGQTEEARRTTISASRDKATVTKTWTNWKGWGLCPRWRKR